MHPLLLSLPLLFLVGTAHAEPRTYLGLTVDDPPAARTESTRGRIPVDFEGTLLVSERRIWVGMPVPTYVPLGVDTMELVRLQTTPMPSSRVMPPVETQSGHLALYREMFGREGDEYGCAINDMWANCRQIARFYRADGTLGFEVDFNQLFARKTHLVAHDLLLVGRTLYFNEACQSYAAYAKGQCSQVVAVDVSGAPKVLWKSAPKRSNDLMLVAGDYLLTGYGFTDERDFVYVLDRKTGKTVTSKAVKKAPSLVAIHPATETTKAQLELFIYDQDEPVRFVLEGFFPGETLRKPRMTLVTP